MILGETYRKIREEKGISISSLAGAEISKSQISRFELGETEISVFKLLYLLERIIALAFIGSRLLVGSSKIYTEYGLAKNLAKSIHDLSHINFLGYYQ